MYKYRFSIDRKLKPEDRKFRLKARVCVFAGPVAWFYLIVPPTAGRVIHKRFSSMHRGWGSLPVNVSSGSFVWQTSIFADKKSSSYILPLKLEARQKTGVKKGDVLNFELTIR